jgi:hypothetical protein
MTGQSPESASCGVKAGYYFDPPQHPSEASCWLNEQVKGSPLASAENLSNFTLAPGSK